MEALYKNQTDNQEDALLLAGIALDDRKAFERIYRKYANDLFKYARRSIDVKEDCEEIVQDVFESLWTRRRESRILVLRFYLIKMVRYKLIRYFQHNSVKRRYAAHFLLFEAAFEHLDVDKTNLDYESMIALIEKSIVQLPERCQTAFRLRLSENLSNSEIAERMNITNKTVENYIVIVLRHLKTSYQGMYNTL